MDGAHSMHGRDERCIWRFRLKIHREEATCETKALWEDNIKMDLQEIGGCGLHSCGSG